MSSLLVKNNLNTSKERYSCFVKNFKVFLDMKRKHENSIYFSELCKIVKLQ